MYKIFTKTNKTLALETEIFGFKRVAKLEFATVSHIEIIWKVEHDIFLYLVDVCRYLRFNRSKSFQPLMKVLLSFVLLFQNLHVKQNVVQSWTAL